MEHKDLHSLCVSVQELLHRGEVDAAEQQIRPALAASPSDPNLIFLAGNCAMVGGKDERATKLFKEVYAKAPTYVPAILNLGFLLRKQHRIAEARHILRKGLSYAPNNSSLWITLSGTYVNEGESVEGELIARQGLLHCPDAADLHWNLALLLLEQGKWEEGWKEYLHRFDSSVMNLQTHGLPQQRPPRLNRIDDIRRGDHIICLGEQGLGDEILFMSMISDLIAEAEKRGVTVQVDANPRLQSVFERSFPKCTFRAGSGSPKPTWMCPIGDLGSLFRRTQEDFPSHNGYLRVDERRVAEIRQQLKNRFGAQQCIGIAWTGGSPRTHQRYRQIPLNTFQPILSEPFHFISLQYKDDTDEIAQLESDHGIIVHRLPELTQAKDYDETFHLVAALDLVICVPTSVLHVAGAIGKQCWVLVDDHAAWREASADDSISWYPQTHKKFHKAPQAEDWRGVIKQIKQELTRRMHRKE